ncbi:hypothetical protein AAG906_017812 [Vitis piasezkii]
MNLSRRLSLLIQQFRALLKKNFLLSWWNKKVVFVQLFSFPLVLFLLFWMEKVIDFRFVYFTAFHNVYDPMSLLPCFDFTWNGNESPKIQSIVHDIMTKNPRGLIPSKRKTGNQRKRALRRGCWE